MAAAKEMPVNQQIEEAVAPLRAELEKLTKQCEELIATNELLQETLAGDVLKFTDRIDGFEKLLGDPKAGAKDAFARTVLGHLLVLLKTQRGEMTSARQPLADVALVAGEPLIREAIKITDQQKQEKLKEMKNDGR